MISNIVFEQIILRNFMSYGNSPITIPLNLPGTTLIQGQNLDNTEQGIIANGVGKTVLVHALVYALYGEALMPSIKLDELVNDVNEKNCMVSVIFTINNTKYQISRHRKSTDGPSAHYVTIYKDDDKSIDLAAGASSKNTDEWISSLIGMPKKLFIRLVIYDADEQSFLSLSAGDQREILENLFNLTILSEKADQLKIESSKTTKLIDHEQININHQLLEVDQYQQRLRVGQSRYDAFENTKQTEIDNLQTAIKDFHSIDFDLEMDYLKKRIAIETEIVSLEQHISDCDTKLKMSQLQIQAQQNNINNEKSKLDSKYEKIISENAATLSDIEVELTATQFKVKELTTSSKTLNGDITQHDAHILRIKNHISDLEKANVDIQARLTILQSGTCPECGQSTLKHDHKVDYEFQIDTNNQTVRALLQEIQDIQLKQQIIRNNINTITTSLVELNESINIRQQEKTTWNVVHQKFIQEQQQLKICELDEACRGYQEIITACKNDDTITLLDKDGFESTLVTISSSKPSCLFNSEVNLIQYKNKYEVIQKALTEKQQSINPHLDALEDLRRENIGEVDYTTINNLTNKQEHEKFLIKLFTDKKSFLRKALISKRLPYLNERLKYYLKQMGLPHHIEILNDFTPIIKKRGKSRGFGGLSHGQKARVNFALSFAFRDVLMQMHRKINICILDEVLDKALCGVGTLAAMNMITEKAKEDNLSMFVITHKNELATRFKRIMTVTMKNDFSTISFNDSLPA